VFNEDVSINSCEVSGRGDVVYFGGIANTSSTSKGPVAYSCQFDRNFRTIDKHILEDTDVNIPVVMRRVPGYEILVLGCAKHLVILSHERGRFEKLKKIDNVHTDFCSDLAIRSNIIFSRGLKEEGIKKIQFGPSQLNVSTMNNSTIYASTLPSQPTNIPPPATIVSPAPKTFVPTKYQEYKQKNHNLNASGLLEKISVNRNGTLIYAGGGQGTNILKFDPLAQDYVQVTNNFIGKVQCFGLKATKSGHVMIQEPTTNDLVILKSSGQEQLRFSAAVKFSFPITFSRNPHYSSENDHIVWFSGTNEVAVVDLHDLKMKDYKTFLPSNGPGKDSVALRALLRDEGRTIVVSFVLDNVFGIAYLHKTLVEPDIYLLSDLLPSFKGLFAMDVGAEGTDLIFMAGQSFPSEANKEISYAVVAAVKLENSLVTKTEKKFINRNYTIASSIKRLKPTMNEFAVGTFAHIVILEYAYDNFQELMIFENVHTDIVDDIAVFNNHIFSVTRKDKFVSHVCILNF
jgi:hypothetical protein